MIGQSMRQDNGETGLRLPSGQLLALPQAVVELPSDLSITAVDVAAHEAVASLAEGQGELTGLALWLLAEQHKVKLHNTLADVSRALSTHISCNARIQGLRS